MRLYHCIWLGVYVISWKMPSHDKFIGTVRMEVNLVDLKSWSGGEEKAGKCLLITLKGEIKKIK